MSIIQVILKFLFVCDLENTFFRVLTYPYQLGGGLNAINRVFHTPSTWATENFVAKYLFKFSVISNQSTFFLCFGDKDWAFLSLHSEIMKIVFSYVISW